MAESQAIRAEIAAAKERLRARVAMTKQDVDALADQCGDAPDVLDELVLLYTGIGAYDRVEQTLDRLVALNPDDTKSRVKLAKFLTDRRKTVHLKVDAGELAREHLGKLAASSTLTGEHWLSVANCYTALSHYDNGIAAAQRAVSMLNGFAKISARFSLVEALIGAGKRDDAYREIEVASQDVSQNDQQLRIALLLEKLGYHDRALEITRGVVSSLASGTDPMMYLRAAKILTRQACTEEARALLQSVGFVEFEEVFTLRAFHDICFEVQLNELAVSYAQAALVKSPYDKEMHERVALLRILARRPPAPPLSRKKPGKVLGRIFHRRVT